MPHSPLIRSSIGWFILVSSFILNVYIQYFVFLNVLFTENKERIIIIIIIIITNLIKYDISNCIKKVIFYFTAKYHISMKNFIFSLLEEALPRPQNRKWSAKPLKGEISVLKRSRFEGCRLLGRNQRCCVSKCEGSLIDLGL